MSSSLVRKALELVETEPAKGTQSGKNDVRKVMKIRKKRQQCRPSRVLGDSRSAAALQVEVARQISSGDKDLTSENLKKLVILSSTKSFDFKRAQKIFERTVKTRKPVNEPAPEVSSTAFTDEDFRKFEEDYFVG